MASDGLVKERVSLLKVISIFAGCTTPYLSLPVLEQLAAFTEGSKLLSLLSSQVRMNTYLLALKLKHALFPLFCSHSENGAFNIQAVHSCNHASFLASDRSHTMCNTCQQLGSQCIFAKQIIQFCNSVVNCVGLPVSTALAVQLFSN